MTAARRALTVGETAKLDRDYDVVRGVPHMPGCNCRKAIHRYRCKGCKRVFGWCVGGDPDERCNECWASDNDE